MTSISGDHQSPLPPARPGWPRAPPAPLTSVRDDELLLFKVGPAPTPTPEIDPASPEVDAFSPAAPAHNPQVPVIDSADIDDGSTSLSDSQSNMHPVSTAQANTQPPSLPPGVEARAHRLDVGLSSILHPFVIPADDKSAFPGHKKINGVCPVPGCTWNKTQNIQQHVHACWRSYLYKKVFQVFGDAHGLPGGACPWERCPESHPDPAKLAHHLMSHHQTGRRCMVRREDGVLCGETLESTYADHLEMCHGLLATDKDPATSVTYCGLCFQFVQGKMNLERHVQAHLDNLERMFEQDERSFAPGKDFDMAGICLFHFADTNATPRERLKKYNGMQHMNTHLLKLDGRQDHSCLFPKCSVRMKPVDMVDHYISAHRMCLTPYQRHEIKGDLAALALSAYDSGKLKAGSFAISRT